MDFLATVPVWVYFVVILITYVVVHILTFDPQRLLPERRAFFGRMSSAVLLLLALVFFQREEPLTLLVALALAGAGGYLSGRSTLPPKQAKAKGRSNNDRS